MAEHARRAAETKEAKKGRGTRSARDSNGRFLATKLEGSADSPGARRTRPKKKAVADPNAASPYLQRLSSLADRADRDESIDSTGMAGDDFLASFLGR